MGAAIIRHHKIESSRVMRLILLLCDPDRRQVKGINPLAGGPVQDLAQGHQEPEQAAHGRR